MSVLRQLTTCPSKQQIDSDFLIDFDALMAFEAPNGVGPSGMWVFVWVPPAEEQYCPSIRPPEALRVSLWGTQACRTCLPMPSGLVQPSPRATPENICFPVIFDYEQNVLEWSFSDYVFFLKSFCLSCPVFKGRTHTLKQRRKARV